MSSITKEQLLALSKKFTDTANAMFDYLIANHLDNDELNRKADGLLDSATELAELAAIQTGLDVRNSLDKLNDVTKQIDSTIQKITDIQKIINIATDMLKVAAALTKFNADDIIAAVDDLSKNVEGL